MFETLGFIVNFPPFHPEHLTQHPFDQVMTQSELAGDGASGGGEADFAGGTDADEAIFLQAPQRHRDGWWRYFQEMS